MVPFLRRCGQLIPSVGRLMAILSVLGLAVCCFILGAACMHFEIPPAHSLRNAFLGGAAWYERFWNQQEGDEKDGAFGFIPPTIKLDRADKTWDGFTLYTTHRATRATLIDMRGQVVHR